MPTAISCVAGARRRRSICSGSILNCNTCHAPVCLGSRPTCRGWISCSPSLAVWLRWVSEPSAAVQDSVHRRGRYKRLAERRIHGVGVGQIAHLAVFQHLYRPIAKNYLWPILDTDFMGVAGRQLLADLLALAGVQAVEEVVGQLAGLFHPDTTGADVTRGALEQRLAGRVMEKHGKGVLEAEDHLPQRVGGPGRLPEHHPLGRVPVDTHGVQAVPLEIQHLQVAL